MNNTFPYSSDNKRYHTLNYFYRNRFGCKISKISLNGGFTCPNIDGTVSTGGCTYCSSGSGGFAGNPCDPLDVQFSSIKEKMSKKWSDSKYIAYFQAFTNTYAPLDILQKQYEKALTFDNVVGISIATRADCLPDDVVDYLAQLSKKTYLTVELGLQTIHDKTALLINRGHNYATFLDGYNKLTKKGINVCVHIINGLPLETKQDMIDTATAVGSLNPHIIKIHLLHIMKNTVLCQQYNDGLFNALTLPEYVDIVCEQLRVIPSKVALGRVTGDGDKDLLVAPLWSLKKFVVMNEIDKKMELLNYFQGDLL